MKRVETPSLSEMRARQGAIVAKFMTFFQRKTSLVVEMYNQAFYRQKPTWDKIADFVCNDLCNTQELRKHVKDVQFHPVKMLIFIKMSEDKWRDILIDRIASPTGVVWKDYGVKVKGYSLDAEVKFIRVLGVSPETGEKDIRDTFHELGIGEVVEAKKGLLDENRLPGCTNGTWNVRVKITDHEKAIPSYIHRRDEGELWSLNFEGRTFCCWKCGSGTHIGDKCRDQNRTFEEVFNGGSSDPNFKTPTWAAVVRKGHGYSEVERQRAIEMEAKLKEQNEKRDRERNAEDQRKLLEAQEEARKEELDLQRRQDAITIVNREAAEVIGRGQETSSLVSTGELSNIQLLTAVESAVETTSMNSEVAGISEGLVISPVGENMEEDEIEREMNLIFGLNASKIFPANIDTGS